MPEVREHWGLYYYYHTMAKCLDALGVDEVVDAERQEARLARRHHRGPGQAAAAPTAAGSTTRTTGWKAIRNLVTGYALMALSHCKKK